MKRMEIVVPRASWSDIFSEDPENPLIPGAPHSKRLPKEPAAMHLPCLSFLSKEWGEVQTSHTMMSFKVPSDATLTWNATKLGQKD